jgi:flagellum-specific ATP synthase
MSLPTHTPTLSRLSGVLDRVRATRVVEKRGRVVQLIGLVIESEGPLCAVGEICRIESARHDSHTLAEVVGFREGRVLLMPLGELSGIHPGSEVVAYGRPLEVPVGEELLGRVLNGLGQPIDTLPPIRPSGLAPCMAAPPHPLRRTRIHDVFGTGIKAIDTLIPVGRGQRLGIFAGSGVGKSTLLGMMAAHAEADVNVIALIGERGREVREFLEKDLSEEGRRKSVVVVATSNEPALSRLKGAYTAMAIAEHFRDAGKSVLLMMDSVTRFAMAQREIGLAVGEPPATRGYTPSVFALLPQLLERAGAGERGAITAFFTVLVEGDDMNEPVADTVRGILDGHIVLDRGLAQQNHYPAIDVLQSVSRLTRDLCSQEQLDVAGRARELMSVYRKNSDLINLGAYVAGSNASVDAAIRLREAIDLFLRQRVDSGFQPAEGWNLLRDALAGRKP